MKSIRFSKHCEEKLLLLASRGFYISLTQILECLDNPDRIDCGYKGTFIAQSSYDETHVIRVVYREDSDEIRVITVYPGRKNRYENSL